MLCRVLIHALQYGSWGLLSIGSEGLKLTRQVGLIRRTRVPPQLSPSLSHLLH